MTEAGRPGEADAAAKNATELLRRADLLGSQGQLADARALLEDALALEPGHATAQRKLAGVMAELGDLEAAATGYRQAIALDPACVPAYRGLVEIGALAADDPALPAMERLLENPKTDDWSLVELRFALGQAYDRLGDYDGAFEHFRIGNRLKRARVDFDLERIRRGRARMEAAFDADLLARWRGAGDPTDLPVFVIGMPRSGTTLVEQILAAHPQVHGAGEINDVQDLAFAWPRDTGTRQGFPECVEAATAPVWRALGRHYVAGLQRRAPQARRIVNKLPGNYAYVGFIRLMLPNARIIHCRRDPRDVCLSCFTTLFGPGPDFAYDQEELAGFHRTVEDMMAGWAALLPGEILELRYEDLVGDLQAGVRRLLAFCDLPWDPACVAFHESRRPVQTASLAQVRRPLYGSSVGRWKNYERHLGPLLRGLQAAD